MTQKIWYSINSFFISSITLYLFGIGKIGYFINTQYYWWLLASAILVLLSSFIYGFFLVRENRKSSPAHYSQYIFGAVLVSILISFFVIPLRPLGAESAGYARRIVIKNDVANKAVYVAKSSEPITSLTLIDWVNTLSRSNNPSQYNGQKISIRGFMAKQTDTGFDLGVYQISCCVVDGQLFTLPIKTSLQAPAKDSWANVSGVLEVSGQKPNTVYTLNASKIEPIVIPDNPYQSK
jgi:uncharacterized repeat protein (TIGR03943 family)